MEVIAASRILDIIGIWSSPECPAASSRDIYPLRKHPGLSMLTPKESGKDTEEDEEHEDEED